MKRVRKQSRRADDMSLVSDNFPGIRAKAFWVPRQWVGCGADPHRFPHCSQPIMGWLAHSFSSTFGSSHDVVVMCEVTAQSLGCMSQQSSVSPRLVLVLHLSSGLATVFSGIQGLSWQMVLMWYYDCFCFGESFLSLQLTVNILAKSFFVILSNI